VLRLAHDRYSLEEVFIALIRSSKAAEAAEAPEPAAAAVEGGAA
jgi:hypothetical protein